MVCKDVVRAGWSWLVLLSIALLTGCDPCSGVAGCGGASIRYRGELIERYGGRPLAGAMLEFIPTGGVPPAGRLVTRTDSLGVFHLEGDAKAAGQLAGRFDLFFDDGTVVDTISGVRLATAASPADSRHLGSWRVDWPHFETYGQIFSRATGKAARGVEVEFRRTGGAHASPDTFVVRTDSFGNFPLRPRPLTAHGEVVGDLIIRPAALRADTVRGVRIRSYAASDPNPFVGRWVLGPNLPFAGRAVWGDDGGPAAGVQVRFQRTGGIPVEPDQYVATTDANGAFSLGPTPLQAGVVEFTLTFTPPAPLRAITYPYSLRTTEEDGRIILIETWVLPR